MLTKNFQDGFAASSSIQEAVVKTMAGTTYGNLYIGNLSYSATQCQYGGNYSGGPNVVIGAGDTPPTKEDYDLADASIMASDKMKSLSQTASWTKDGGAVVTCQWTNNSDAAITIKEMGMCLKISNTAYSKAANVLVARKVLDTPLTIQPNEVYAFTYSIRV